ncbi:MAG: sugar ABC transporter substrate-binding protein [Deltaproteobacteria bacterium]|nr:MAG: sugar ABC transporter substrate-binding protein [Deltaproteobacteria bacterium]
MRHATITLLVVLFATLVYCGEDYMISSGDRLYVDVWGVEQLTGDVIVRPDGKVTLPAVGDVPASGKTSIALADELKVLLNEYVKHPVVTVTVVEVNNNKIYVTGEGVASSVIRSQKEITLMRVLAQAGSLEGADLENARVLRDGTEVYRNFFKLYVEGDIAEDFPLRADDIVFIPGVEKRKIYVLGAVAKNDVVYHKKGMTALDAILMSGGFAASANREVIILVRKDGKRIELPIGEIMRGESVNMNIPLERGDYVIVQSYEDEKISVSGAVNAPTTLVYSHNMKILDAIYAAGGFSAFANREKVILLRTGAEKRVLNLEEVMDGESVDANILLTPGDHIIVKESLF